MPLSDLFKSKKELEAEAAKQQKRELRQATRSCDRTQMDLERQEKDLESQIKKAANKGDQSLAKTLAKQLIRVRAEKSRAVGVKSKIGTISGHATSMQANNKLAAAVASASSAIASSNTALRPEQLSRQMEQFKMENAKMDMKDEAMEQMFSEIFNDSEEEAEGDAIMNEVLDEIGVELSSKLRTAPTPSKDAVASASTTKESVANQNEMEKRLERLKHI